MALFREHITVGALVAAVGVVLLYFYAIVTDPLLLALLFFVTVGASFLPDIDSDSGIPFYLIFGTFTLACAGIALYFALTKEYEELYLLIGVPVGTFLFVWFVIGAIFKSFTTHRGILHSIPATLIAGLLTFLVAKYLEHGETTSLTFALAVGAGYASHLILDELHAENILNGNPFERRRSLGSAVKLFSYSAGINIFTYLILVVLIYLVVR